MFIDAVKNNFLYTFEVHHRNLFEVHDWPITRYINFVFKLETKFSDFPKAGKSALI